jgi:hypothetical protein
MSRLGSFFKLIGIFWKNSDKVIKLLDMMENQLPNVGQALQNAGQLAILTSQAINGGNGLAPGMVQVIGFAADAVNECGNKVKDIPPEIERIKQTLHDLNIPSISISDKEYHGPGFKITVPIPSSSEWYPLRGVENFLAKEIELLQTASTQLDTTQQKLHLLSSKTADAGNQLNQMGIDLKEAGRLLKGMGSITIPSFIIN